MVIYALRFRPAGNSSFEIFKLYSSFELAEKGRNEFKECYKGEWIINSYLVEE